MAFNFPILKDSSSELKNTIITSNTMTEKFIERGTDYSLEYGKLSVYETNCSCRDIKFYFEQHVLTLMFSGHKTIITDNLRFEFFPGTFFIPESRTVHTVHIPNASLDNPTKCLVLELDPDFLNSYYEEVFYQTENAALFRQEASPKDLRYFFSNDRRLIEAFIRLYEHRLLDHTRGNALIGTLLLKEVLLRVFQTDGLYLLKHNFEQQVADRSIQRSIAYIRSHLGQKITVEQLAQVSGVGLTTFFKRFKRATGLSPVDYLLRERIKQSKILILKNQINLKEVAYRCGFNSYEYFCSCFKKIEREKPTEFKRKRIAQAAQQLGAVPR